MQKALVSKYHKATEHTTFVILFLSLTTRPVAQMSDDSSQRQYLSTFKTVVFNQLFKTKTF